MVRLDHRCRWCLPCVMVLIAFTPAGALLLSSGESTVAVHTERGAAAMAAFDTLPYFKEGTTVHQASSFDRTGGNDDGERYYLYKNAATGGYVVMQEQGPGTIYRTWATEREAGGFEAGAIRIYFDNEDIPRVDASLSDFFSGTLSPFLFPLVGDDNASSGGSYCYYPFSFKEAVRVEFSSVPRYYQITYHLYSSSDGVTTYTGDEDLSAVYEAWSNASVDPKRKDGNETVVVEPFDLGPGQSKTLLEVTGHGSLRSLILTFPQLVTTQYAGNVRVATDNGRGHAGSSTFAVAVEPDNAGVALIRRLDYGVPNQTAEVYVDGESAGVPWHNAGVDYAHRWRDSRFNIPVALTHGKTQISVTLEYASPAYYWTEYCYWVRTIRSTGEELQTDVLDIGTAESELDHSYQVVGEVWHGTSTFSYPPLVSTAYDSATVDILSRARLQIYWDGDTNPSVDVPVGYFFGVGSSGEGSVRGLLIGTDPITHAFYNYFPMPYDTRARVYLLNHSGTTIRHASAELQYNPEQIQGLGSRAGYFTAFFAAATPPTLGQDYVLMDLADARGHIVGVVLDIMLHANLSVLEGDERIFIDSAIFDPQLHGTGTEDLFNGGWYFNRGIFTLPVHGNPLHHNLDAAHITMYRLTLGDFLPFESSMTFRMEHGSENVARGYYRSAVFAYIARSAGALRESDSLLIGDLTAEHDHAYVAAGETRDEAFAGTFVGRDDGRGFSGTARYLQGSSTFVMSISPKNRGVRLGRILDHAANDQSASVYVDGVYAGVWLTQGSNPYHRAAYDFFEIPEGLTTGKSLIQVRLESKPGSTWTECLYYCYSHMYPPEPTFTTTPINTQTPAPVRSPTPTTTVTQAATELPTSTLTPSATPESRLIYLPTIRRRPSE